MKTRALLLVVGILISGISYSSATLATDATKKIFKCVPTAPSSSSQVTLYTASEFEKVYGSIFQLKLQAKVGQALEIVNPQTREKVRCMHLNF